MRENIKEKIEDDSNLNILCTFFALHFLTQVFFYLCNCLGFSSGETERKK
jgi:hypothetical protein